MPRMHEPLGDFIDGRFLPPTGTAVTSSNPVDDSVVLATAWDEARIGQAVEAAASALTAWRALPMAERHAVLVRFADALAERREGIAEAIRLEVGKIQSEADVEAASLVSRIPLVASRIELDLREGPLPGFSNESLRHHPHGVVGVIGPFNFPLHLCHAYVVPALLLGNTVVVKPSEVALLASQRYAEAAQAAGFPPGVLNVVAGGGAAGAALASRPEVRGLCFTGSWNVGRRILEAGLDRPEMLVALEMGGKNAAIVLDDADVRQAAHEIVIGGYLTTGQRCTCTDRVLVQPGIKNALVDAISGLVKTLRMGDPSAAESFAGPLTTRAGVDKLHSALAAARARGGVEVARGSAADGARFVVPTLHLLPDGVHDIRGYTDVELFAPDLCVEMVDGEDEVVAALRGPMSGFVHSVFTASQARFDRLYRDLSCGMLNHNRSTNRASPRLPFGGVGRSGNFRPAGSYAPRALSFPVAVLDNPLGTMEVHAKLRDALPPPDLDGLERRHAAEEDAQSARTLLDEPRPHRVRLPRAGRLPESEAQLARLYGDGRMPREKKPGVFDHLRSGGPWFASVDPEPLCVLDGMSQTATMPAGFSADEVVRTYVEGGFGDSVIRSPDTSVDESPEARAFADRLRELVSGLPQVSFVNSGAESCEKALALCHLDAKSEKQTRVLAFEGGFHGRTLLSLHASFNPTKREPFQIAGHEVTFVPFPVWWTPHDGEPRVVEEWLASAATGDVAAMRRVAESAKETERSLLELEVKSLSAVDEALRSGEYYALIIEPMQSEGGDRYATSRFFKALRLLTRHYGVPLVFDEVQTGFGLGGTFAWHTRFGLVDAAGAPDWPDCVTFAKRAQVGVVMSRFEDPEPTCAHPASLVRGRVHADLMAIDSGAPKMEQHLRDKLADLARRHPELVQNPRATGYAFAYDLPTPGDLARYVPQRFWRGNIVFAAGTRTVRHRLSPAFSEKHIDRMFSAMHRSLCWLEANPGVKPPSWLDFPEPGELLDDRPAPAFRVRRIEPSEHDSVLAKVCELEARLFEAARRDTEQWLKRGFDDPDGVVVVVEVEEDEGWCFAGCAIGAPVERVTEAEGPDRDPMTGRYNTFYSISVTLDPEFQGYGLGHALKVGQLREAAAARRSDGTKRYLHAAGRARVGETGPMTAINRALGAYTVFTLQNQYGEEGAEALYYRMPLGPFTVHSAEGLKPASEKVDLRQGLAMPFAEPPESLRALYDQGQLFGPTVNKITICNYVTPAIVRGVEWVAALVPELPHLYLTSSRDEAFDKTVRTFRFSRKESSIAIGFDGGYLGHTTAAARSLSDPAVHNQGAGYFSGWKRVPHPADVGVEASLTALRSVVSEAGGPERIIGLFVEPIQERTGRVVPDAWWPAIDALRAELDIPVAMVETASACYRSGRGAFFQSGVSFVPDVMFWWGGGQVGFVHVGKRYFLQTPLMMVSTWDGDELSLVRVNHQLRAARHLDLSAASLALGKALGPADAAGMTALGEGLYRVLDAGEKAAGLVKKLAEHGLLARELPGGRVPIVPPLDRLDEVTAALTKALADVS